MLVPVGVFTALVETSLSSRVLAAAAFVTHTQTQALTHTQIQTHIRPQTLTQIQTHIDTCTRAQ